MSRARAPRDTREQKTSYDWNHWPHTHVLAFFGYTTGLFLVAALLVSVTFYTQKEEGTYPHAPTTPPGQVISEPDIVVDSIPVAKPSEPQSTPTATPTPPPPIAPPTPSPQPLPAQGLRYDIGIAFGETLSVASADDVAQALDDLVDLRIGWIRVDLAWSSIQPTNSSTYAWDAFDRIVRMANERGIRVLPILTYTPRWARAEECVHTSKCHPRSEVEFATFAGAAATRYAPQGVYAWEIWNEPNMGMFWAPHADPQAYTALLVAAYGAIKSVDPNATVISGGLAPVLTKGVNMNGREFLEGMYIAGAKDSFDALGFHPYTYPARPNDYDEYSAWSQMEETKLSIRGIMKYNGDGDKLLWLTEYGAPTGGPGSVARDASYSRWRTPDHVTEEYQAALLREAVLEARALDFVGPFFWYSYRDLGTDDATRENFFGIIRSDGSKKPAYTMLRGLLTD